MHSKNHASIPPITCMHVLCMLCAGVPDQMVDAVTLLRDRAESDDSNALYSLVNDLSKVFFWYC